jgi:hypothetical protein
MSKGVCGIQRQQGRSRDYFLQLAALQFLRLKARGPPFFAHVCTGVCGQKPVFSALERRDCARASGAKLANMTTMIAQIGKIILITPLHAIVATAGADDKAISTN